MARRGRPKKQSTLKSDETNELLKQVATQHPMSKEESDELNDFLEKSEILRRTLIKQHSPTIPHRLIYEVESLGDESMIPHQDKIMKEYLEKADRVRNGRLEGAMSTSDQSQVRANNVWGRNNDLIEKIIGKSCSIHSASQKILDEWDLRGDGKEKPAIRTLENWYHKVVDD
jgi:hypothetical protein